MKSNRGITLLSLIIYITVLVIVLAILSMISNSFYSNTKFVMEQGKYVAEYNQFNMYFIEDVKHNTKAYQVTSNQVIFADGTTYHYDTKSSGIYRNQVKIASHIVAFKFSEKQVIVSEKEKQIITVTMRLKGSKLLQTSNDYVLKYW